MYKHSTQVPNALFDYHLKTLTSAELKILLIIIRQTNGWVDKYTGHRKTQDWISYSQFITKTGLSRRTVTSGIQSLSEKQLINISCQNGNSLDDSGKRRGQTHILYSLNMCTFKQEHVQFPAPTSAKIAHNKTNYTKETKTKLRADAPRSNTLVSIGELLKGKKYGIIS